MKFFAWALVGLLVAARLAGEEEATPEELADPNFFKNNRRAQVVEWRDPVCPPEVIADGKVVFTRVRFIVEPDGSISALRAIGGNDDRYQEAVLAAVGQWKFTPDTRKGKAVRSSREIQFRFDPSHPPKRDAKKSGSFPYMLEGSPSRPPVERSCPEPVYPKELEPRRLKGIVEMHLGVNEEGRVAKAQVTWSSYAEFTEAAIATVANWEFTPAASGELPEKGVKESVLDFVVINPDTGNAQREDWLVRNGIILTEPAGRKPEEQFDQMPEAKLIVDPVYPYELARADTAGAARVNFTIDQNGRVKDVEVAEATEPRFGEALVAAISAWLFEPLIKNGEKTTGAFSITRKFVPPEPAAAAYGLLHLDAAAKLPGISDVDGKLVPVYRVAPVYPENLRAEKVAGEADIEVFIDRNGRVRWPRVKGATRPELGWAAATAAAQWFFEAPRQAGQPVDVRVVIPFRFNPEG